MGWWVLIAEILFPERRAELEEAAGWRNPAEAMAKAKAGIKRAVTGTGTFALAAPP